MLSFKKLIPIILQVILLQYFAFNFPVYSNSLDKNKPANSLSVVNYSRNLLYSIVDSNFRGSWVIDPDSKNKIEEKTKKLQKSFESLAQVKIGSSPQEVKKILNNPIETRNNGKIWIYGIQNNDGTYSGLMQVFFDDKIEHVTGVTSFNSKNIVEDIGVSIGDDIGQVISVYGEPVDEKDFIEDPDNKDYLGLYYLYPRSGLGFLIGQDQSIKKNLIVKGVIVFGKG